MEKAEEAEKLIRKYRKAKEQMEQAEKELEKMVSYHIDSEVEEYMKRKNNQSTT